MNADTPALSEIVGKLRLHDKDVGSPQVQIANLTARIKHLTGHLENHKKDNHSLRGLMGLIARRRRLTAYLKRTAPESHSKTLVALGLRK